jgi:hypothetical protein
MPLGSFEVESDALIVSDPGHEAELAEGDHPLSGLVPNPRRGTWNARVTIVDAGDWGPRVSELVAVHAGSAGAAWQPSPHEIGVDSGQAGIFDRAHFGRDSDVPKDYRWGKEGMLVPEEPWYSLCCDKTLSETQAGTIPFGAVSSAGLGDGSYRWFVRRDAGEAVAVRIEFLTEEDLK